MKKTDAQLKTGCFLPQREQGYYSCRIKVIGGYVTTDHMEVINEIARIYGRGYVHLTARQSLEIPFIELSSIEAVEQRVSDANISLGNCGAGIRTITACQGDTVCKSGMLDTTALAFEIDKRFQDAVVPHKFKIGITGCQNNCLKAEENDIGIKGAVKPKWQKNACTYCGICQGVCPVKAITVDRTSQTLDYNKDLCINCGRCIKGCRDQAWDGEKGYLLYFGGLFGNKISIGRQLFPVIESKEELFLLIEKTLIFFRTHGKKKERFANTIDRVGWDVFYDHLRKESES